MPFVNTKKTVDAFAANGGSDGYVTVTSNAAYYPGATCWLYSNTVNPKQYVITDLVGSTKIGVREVRAQGQGPIYTRSDVSAYTTIDNAGISQEACTVPVELSNVAKLPLM